MAAWLTVPRWRESLTIGAPDLPPRARGPSPPAGWTPRRWGRRQGLGVLAAYAVAALTLGGVALEVRDA